ncbi:UNVERIFIED_CONTAM: hypothetical protein NCL1_22069 [Trichonephila clavipes]
MFFTSIFVPFHVFNSCLLNSRSSSSYTSHRSTPLHCGYTSLSCPTLPIDYPVVTKSTQTDPVFGASFFIDSTPTERVLCAGSTYSINKALFSPPITPCGKIPETFLLSDVCEIHREPEDHSYPRHRTNSFLSAVKEGNPKLIDAEFENEAEKKQARNDLCEIVKKNETSSDHQSSIYDVSSSFSSVAKNTDEGRSISDEVKECVFPRKLSILLEEDYEEVSGNLFSVCSSQPILNKKRKASHSCTAKTQTDLSYSSSLTPKKAELPITEQCLPRCGFAIVSHTVQKKTIYSEELPKRLVLRHPPPYMKKCTRNRINATFQDNCFQHSKSKTPICKWFTVCESLPSRSESSQNLTPNSQNNRLQTRHFSLEKQESFSSCDHSLYPDSQMSSVTDFSGWITKSDIELNLRPEPPSYQQSILASQRCHLTRNRWDWKYVTLLLYV